VRFTEIDVFGVYVAPMSLMMVGAWLVTIPGAGHLPQVERPSETTAVAATQSNAWALAGRTATVNLSARCVVFERTVSSVASPTRDKERRDR